MSNITVAGNMTHRVPSSLTGVANLTSVLLGGGVYAPGLWLGANALSPASNNYAMQYVSTDGTLFNSPSGQRVFFRVGNVNALVIGSGLNVGIGTAAPVSSAALQIVSTTRGFLPPKMTTVERNAITNITSGLIVYNTTDNAISLHNGTAWGNVLTTHSASFTSATLAAAVTDETGSGSLVFAESPSLTSPTIGTSATFNATTYTYGAGAADAHRTALGLASFTTLSPAELQSKVFSNSLLSSPLMSFFDDCDGRYGYTVTQSGTGGSIADSNNAGNLAYGVYRVITGAVSANFYRAFARIAGGIKAIGTTFQSIFTIQDITDCEMFIGFTWVGIGQFGLAYRSGLDGGLFTFRHGGSNYATLPASTAAPQNGNFLSGKRYKFTMTQLTNTTSSVLIEEADFNNTTWTTLYSGVVTHGSRLSTTEVGMCPSVEVTTKTNAQRAIFFDYLRFENAGFLR
jgi:hypothetical protein